jgi:hypothetical protein
MLELKDKPKKQIDILVNIESIEVAMEKESRKNLKFLIDKKNVFLLWRYIQNSLSP